MRPQQSVVCEFILLDRTPVEKPLALRRGSDDEADRTEDERLVMPGGMQGLPMGARGAQKLRGKSVRL